MENKLENILFKGMVSLKKLIEPTNPNAVTLCRAECTQTSAEMKILVFSLWR